MKDYILVGPLTAVMYNDMFEMFKQGRVHVGYTMINKFRDTGGGEKIVNKGCIRFYNTMGVSETCEDYGCNRYDKEKYPKYDNYDAINVDRVEDLPVDYNGVMGVPITWLTKKRPGYEIIERTNDPRINGNTKFVRIFIRKISKL